MNNGDLQENLDRARNEKRALEVMMETPGWAILTDALKALSRSRRIDAFGTVVDGLDSSIQLAGKHSEIAGIQLASGLADLLIEDYDADIQVMIGEMEELEDDGRSDNASS